MSAIEFHFSAYELYAHSDPSRPRKYVATMSSITERISSLMIITAADSDLCEIGLTRLRRRVFLGAPSGENIALLINCVMSFAQNRRKEAIRAF